MATIEVKNLSKIFGPNARGVGADLLKEGVSKSEILERTGCTVAIDNASFEVNEREIFVVMGLSGSGKSTVLRCLNRLIEPTGGDVLIDGESVIGMDKHRLREVRREKTAMVFQHFGLLPHRDVVSNTWYGLELQGVPEEEREKKAYEALDLVGLNGYETSMTQELSGGMQQRVGLARALATDPEILLMDEAFSALDPLIRTQMQEELLELQDQMHKSIVFITHDLDEALKLGDRIAIMKDGAVVQVGTPEQILTEPADDYVRAFVENVDRSKVITAGTVMEKARAIDLSRGGPHYAVREMKKLDCSALYVTDHEHILKGRVKLDDALALSKQEKKDLSDAINEDVVTTSPDTPLADLLPVASEESPIAVVNEDKRLLGVVTRTLILTGISGEE
ncbi:MAG: glycine betaine/L-proline ABC transporter ATP-binding protein [Lentisphaeria bacterium]